MENMYRVSVELYKHEWSLGEREMLRWEHEFPQTFTRWSQIVIQSQGFFLKKSCIIRILCDFYFASSYFDAFNFRVLLKVAEHSFQVPMPNSP